MTDNQAHRDQMAEALHGLSCVRHSNLNDCDQAQDYREDADALLASDVLAQIERDAKTEALRIVRQVESDMSEQAMKAWRSADARRGLSDHEALIVHADALTRWSERFRMAFDGDYYRAALDEPTGEA